jgi:hypothetical protein
MKRHVVLLSGATYGLGIGIVAAILAFSTTAFANGSP